MDQINGSIFFRNNPGKQIWNKMDMVKGTFSFGGKIERVHYIWKNHNKIVFVTVNGTAANVHGAASRTDQINLHTGMQMFSEIVMIVPVLDCRTGYRIRAKRNISGFVVHR